jgi:adenine-specific DNA glycosylase
LLLQFIQVAKAAKAEQQVAVCVLKVLLLPDADTPAAVAAAAAAAAAASPAQPAAAGVKGSIRSFFKPAPKQQQQQQEGGDKQQQQQQQQQQQCQASEGELLAAGAAALYLLVQRPETGVLAGLWEFPGGRCELDHELEHELWWWWMAGWYLHVLYRAVGVPRWVV